MGFRIVFTLVLAILSACGSSTSDEPSESAAQSSGMSSNVDDGSTPATSPNEDTNLTDDAPEMNGATTTEPDTDSSNNIPQDEQASVFEEPMARAGHFSLIQRNFTDETEVLSVASFHSFDTELDPVLEVPSADDQIEFLRPDDSCFVSDFNSQTGTQPALVGFDVSERIYAGETLTLTSPSGTYAEVQLVEYAGSNAPEINPFNYLATDLTAPVPSGLTLSVPGASFPAFNEVAIPDIPAVTGKLPMTAGEVNTETVFTWDASGNKNATISILAANVPAMDSENTSIVVLCKVKDDGYFTFPEATKVELGSRFVANQFNLVRSVFEVINDGDTFLFLHNRKKP